MMKWRVRRESRCNSIDHEDIRRSLEVLDKVLAEFDDCCEAWETSTNSINGVNNVSITNAVPQKVSQENTSVQTNGNCHHYASTNGNNNYVKSSSFKAHKDGATSQAFRLPEQTQQLKNSSPPPVPRRSPRTKLSERNSLVFTFTNEENNNKCDSLKSESDGVENSVLSSPFGQVEPISVLSAGDDVAGQDDDVFSHTERESESKHCAPSSSCDLSDVEKSVWIPAMEPDATDEATCESSSFAHKRQMFENKIAEAASRSPQISRKSQKSQRRTTNDDGTKSEPTSLCTYSSSESGHSLSSSSLPPSCQSENSKSPKSSHFPTEPNDSQPLGTSPSPKMNKESAIHSDEDDHEVLSSSYHAPNCKCRERLRRLDEKFAETRRLLKLNKIKELTTKPPDFVPPPPPKKTKESKHNKPGTQEEASVKNPSMSSPRLTSTPTKMVDNPLYESSIISSKTGTSDDQLHRGNSSKSLILSERIEDLPNLLPTDALNRPHLGLSYSLEEDLCPGVKEIRQISPKSDSVSPFQSSPNMTKEYSSLSTFSQSASSLGYVSSQSDLELNSPTPELETKIPVSSLKSHTLPPGIILNPSPFYSDVDKSNDTRDELYRNSDSFTDQVQLRSSSAPPPVPQPEMDKKKHKRIFSKRERKKNDDNLSVKSDLSLDEGIIIKKFETLDGTTCFTDADKKEPGGEKKRSVWKSILRRK